MTEATKTEPVRCDRCMRPATQKVKASYFREHGVSGAFCGRHAAKSGFPCVGLTARQAGLGAPRASKAAK